ncbi:colipase-like protein 2 isoform X2 [Saimiri boliviensis]|uniref:Colipase-like protein 2 n=1 Tax=Saimiri boliviensis boliviensis TaxID=39432 RepID=A0A2K6TMX4_SAIBB|nr:colipase-like protein 2 isoform X2 [Saimiri boliviensis boliviensis]
MAAAVALVAGILAGVLAEAGLPRWRALPHLKKRNTDRCFHHSECFSGCCLLDLDSGGAFCAPRARITMICLPQTKGAINIICPCRMGLRCTSEDLVCSRRCHMI